MYKKCKFKESLKDWLGTGLVFCVYKVKQDSTIHVLVVLSNPINQYCLYFHMYVQVCLLFSLSELHWPFTENINSCIFQNV